MPLLTQIRLGIQWNVNDRTGHADGTLRLDPTSGRKSGTISYEWGLGSPSSISNAGSGAGGGGAAPGAPEGPGSSGDTTPDGADLLRAGGPIRCWVGARATDDLDTDRLVALLGDNFVTARTTYLEGGVLAHSEIVEIKDGVFHSRQHVVGRWQLSAHVRAVSRIQERTQRSSPGSLTAEGRFRLELENGRFSPVRYVQVYTSCAPGARKLRPTAGWNLSIDTVRFERTKGGIEVETHSRLSPLRNPSTAGARRRRA
jgi:hypothetical protein